LFGNPGITAFEIAILPVKEPNAQFTPGAHGLRADFIAQRADGLCARLHPSSAKEAKVIIGPRENWAGPEDGKWAMPPQPLMGTTPQTYSGFGESDRISKKDLHHFLSQWLQENPEAERPIKVDMTETWPWWLHLNSTPDGRSLLQAGVKQVELVENNDKNKKDQLEACDLQLLVTCHSGWQQTIP